MFTKLSLTSSRYPSILTAFNHSLTTFAHGSNIFKSSSLLISRYETFINRNLDSEHVEFTKGTPVYYPYYEQLLKYLVQYFNDLLPMVFELNEISISSITGIIS